MVNIDNERKLIWRLAVIDRPAWMKRKPTTTETSGEFVALEDVLETPDGDALTSVVEHLATNSTPFEDSGRATRFVDSASTTELVSLEDVIAEQGYFSFESLPPFPHPLRKPFHAAYWLFELVFGVVSLFAFLALLAAIPIVNVLALGYMLEAQGRVARTGKLRYAMPLLPLAPKLGGIALGTWVWYWLVRLVADAASDAALIAPRSGVAVAWSIGLMLLCVFVTIHLVLAIARGGRLGLFFWPTPLNGFWLFKRLRRGDYATSASLVVRDFIAALRLRHHFWLGLRGFVGAFVLLFIPTVLFGALHDTSKPGQIILTLLGGLLLVLTLSWVPFLQARFAAENRLSAMFKLRSIRELFRRTPIVFLLALVVLYALSLPLYLFKLFEVPQDLRWALTPIFIVSIYPSKILIGWAYSRAVKKERHGWFTVRLVCNLLLLPLLSFYVLMLFFTPAVGAAGRAILFQHHAVLLPWPF